ncbi:hypothetical protein [Niveibacterium sp.]|uniref:hypothetical protein n=1 Tax=Niveibacterium sp. TaxID=2017444 RepID=UPI0035AE76DD
MPLSATRQDQNPPSADVILSFDVEVWADGWGAIDEKIQSAFNRRIYGHSREHGAGLQGALRILAEHQLHAVFFVEPLFAARVGESYLSEIVELILRHGQEIQLHIHPEWAYELRTSQLAGFDMPRRTRNIADLDVAAQDAVLKLAIELLGRAGAPRPIAFRAGSYAFRRSTLSVLAANGLQYDSSLNVSNTNSGTDLGDQRQTRVAEIDQVVEVPIAQIVSSFGKPRQAQIGSSGLSELKHLIRLAARTGAGPTVIVSHNNEMTHRVTGVPDEFVLRRFRGLCQWLAANPQFRTTGFSELDPGAHIGRAVPELRNAHIANVLRNVEQYWRQRRYY